MIYPCIVTIMLFPLFHIGIRKIKIKAVKNICIKYILAWICVEKNNQNTFFHYKTIILKVIIYIIIHQNNPYLFK